MELSKFIEILLDGVVKENGMENILKSIKDNIDYDLKETKIELQLFEGKDNEFNHDVDISVSNESYDDGEIIFLDLYKKQ